MNRLRATIERAFADLSALGNPWAVVGGLAVSSYVEPRTTRDLDVVVSVSGDPEAPVASIGHLIAMKVLARDDRRRPRDWDDLRELIAIANPNDLHQARSALTMITARGYARDRDLIVQFEELLEEFGSRRSAASLELLLEMRDR